MCVSLHKAGGEQPRHTSREEEACLTISERQQGKSPPAAGVTEHCRQVFIPRAQAALKDKLPCQTENIELLLPLVLQCWKAPTTLLISLFSACSSGYFVIFVAISLKRLQPIVPAYEEEGPSQRGERGLKRQKKEGAFPAPFLLQLCCVQKMISHPSRETPREKHNHVSETWMPLQC